MARLKFTQFPVLAVLALVFTGCDVSVGDHGFSMGIARGKAQDEWKRTYPVKAGGQLEIVNINGVINASPGAGSVIEVRAERIAKASSDEAAQDMLKKIEIVETASADRVRLETKVPRMNWGRSGHEVRYYVKVPQGLAVNFETTNGAVRLDNLDGRIVASTTNGGVRGSGLKGAVKASTTNGGVDIGMASVTDDIELETTNGGIRLELPRNAKATLDVRCTNGGIRLTDFELDGETTRRRAAGTINGGGPKVSVETTNGGIRISAGGRSETD
jgi:hypothetical protein